MIDLAANAAWRSDFLAGAMFGISLLLAATVITLMIIMPGKTNWSAFAAGSVIAPGFAVAIIVAIVFLLWWLEPNGA